MRRLKLLLVCIAAARVSICSAADSESAMRVVLLLATTLAALPAAAQHQHGSDESPAGPAVHQASGTSANPASSPMEMIHLRAGGWTFMLHGTGFLTDIQQSGPRGGDKLAGMGWFMGVAERKLGRGSLALRTMLSPDPATITDRRYPLLFQTGETAFGKPLVDAQHPHDLFMEISAQYRYAVAERTHLYVYFAPVGDPALGPVAFPHRVSAAELPQATLSHHVQDSSHIVNEVLTAGVAHGIFRVEASGFHGAEPNENRWNVDHGGIDSWSARVAVDPAPNWSAQVSLGRLHRPEALEPGDTLRSTASITYNRPLASGNWATSLIWGRNHKRPTGGTSIRISPSRFISSAARTISPGVSSWLIRTSSLKAVQRSASPPTRPAARAT